jgi:hypothetical protein
MLDQVERVEDRSSSGLSTGHSSNRDKPSGPSTTASPSIVKLLALISSHDPRQYRRIVAYRIRPRMPARYRIEEDRWHVSVRPVPRLDQVRNHASIAVQRERSEIWNR